jgi:hypothetical protein
VAGTPWHEGVLEKRWQGDRRKRMRVVAGRSRAAGNSAGVVGCGSRYKELGLKRLRYRAPVAKLSNFPAKILYRFFVVGVYLVSL